MHDDQKLTAGDKVVQKMTRDGMVEENLAEKTSHRVSQRVEDAVLMKKPDPEESPDVSAAAQKRKKRRAQRIRDADAAKNTDSGNTGQEASDSTSDVEEPAGGSRKMLSEESLRRSPPENADPVKNSRKKGSIIFDVG